MNTRTMALLQAIDRAGSQRALARLIGAKQQNIWDWIHKGKQQVSADYVMRIEAATGVSRHDLRPDIFGPAPATTLPRSVPASLSLHREATA